MHRNRNYIDSLSFWQRSENSRLWKKFSKNISIFSFWTIFVCLKHWVNISVWSNNIYLIHKNIRDFLIIMFCFISKITLNFLIRSLKENIRNYFRDLWEDWFHFLADWHVRRKSERIRTHHPVHHFGIYPHTVSRYAGHAISRWVSFAFPWK